MIKTKYNLDELNRYVDTGKFTVEKHNSADIYIYGYSQMDSDTSRRIKWNNTNINLRGLIVDSKGNVLSRSFQKFFTFKKYLSKNTIFMTEGQIKTIKSDKMRIFEKVDGTFTVLYWIDNIPYLATQRSFRSPKALKATKILYNKYSHTFDKLDKNKTYIFEAIYHETKVLVDYGNEHKLYLLGIVDTETGKDYELKDIGFPIAKEYTQELQQIKNLDDLKNLNLPNMEGFVIKYGDGLRIKIKFPWYDKTHRVFNQIIAYKNAAFQLEEQLRGFLEIPDNKLTQRKIWTLFEKGIAISEIEKNLPDVFYSLGVEEWLKSQHNEYVKYINKNKTIESKVFDERPYSFEERIDLPESECVVWNRINRLTNQYN